MTLDFSTFIFHTKTAKFSNLGFPTFLIDHKLAHKILISMAFENLNIINNLIHHLIIYQKFDDSALWQYFNKLGVTMKLSDHENEIWAMLSQET